MRPGGVLLVIGLAGAGGVLPPVPGVIHAQEITYQGSLQYATGSYVFTQRTQTFWLSNGFHVRSGRLSLSASVPVVLQNSNVISSVGGVMMPTGGPGHGQVGLRQGDARMPMGSRHGSGGMMTPDGRSAGGDYHVALGDLLASASLEVYRGTGAMRSVAVDLGTKAPFADLDSGVGTGEWDYSVGSSLVAGVWRTLLFADLSYWWLGDLPELELKDALSYGLGIGAPLGAGQWSGLLSLSGSTRVIETLDPPASISVGASYSPGAGTGLNAGVSFGLTEAAPSAGFFLGWRTRVR